MFIMSLLLVHSKFCQWISFGSQISSFEMSQGSELVKDYGMAEKHTHGLLKDNFAFSP